MGGTGWGPSIPGCPGQEMLLSAAPAQLFLSAQTLPRLYRSIFDISLFNPQHETEDKAPKRWVK